MFSHFEEIIRHIYRQSKAIGGAIDNNHPDEEALVCFLEDKLAQVDKDSIQEHLLKCHICAEYVSTQLKIEPHLSKDVPVPLLEKIREIVASEVKDNILEIFIRLKEKVLEIIQTSGDVLVGQELIPAPVLRSRQINEFKDEVSVLKDFKEIRVLVKIESKSNKVFSLVFNVKNKQGQRVSRDLRVTLIKNRIELESYILDSDSSVFENIAPGNYTIELTRETKVVAVVDLKVKA